MADTPWYAPGFKGEAPSSRPSTTVEALWRARKDGLRADGHASTRLFIHQSDNPLAAGVEFQMLHDGELAYGRRWPTRGLAMLEAENERRRLEQDGWTFESPPQ